MTRENGSELDMLNASADTYDRGTVLRRRMIGRVVLLVGDVLLVVAFFAPWVKLFVTYSGDVPGTGTYSPLVVVWRSIASGDLLSAVAMLLAFIVLLGTSIPLVVRPAGGRQRLWLRPTSAALAIVCLCVTLLLFPFLSFGPSMEWPFLHPDFGYGIWVGIGAFILVAVGAVLVDS